MAVFVPTVQLPLLVSGSGTGTLPGGVQTWETGNPVDPSLIQGTTPSPIFDDVVFGGAFGLKLTLQEFVYYPMRPVRDDDTLDGGYDPAVPNMIINRYKQQPTDTRQRGVDFTLFCQPGETIASVTIGAPSVVTTPPLVVSNLLVDPATGQKLSYTVSGGVDGVEYLIPFTVTFNTGQVQVEQVVFMIAVFEESQYP